MGLEYKIVQSERRVLDEITCDRCGKKIPKEAEGGWNVFGEPYSLFHEPAFACFFRLKQNWGYSSRKDMEEHEAVLCEDCYDIVFKDIPIKVTEHI
jgi:ribosomal protein S26